MMALSSWTTMLFNGLLLLMFCHGAHSLVIHPRLRSYRTAVAASPSSVRQIGAVAEPKVAASEKQQKQHKESENSGNSRMRWYGAEAKQMLRHLDEIRLRSESKQKAKKVVGVSLLDKLVALFTDKPDDEGPKHDCFFSAFNCPVNPARNIPGVRRVRITAEERRKLLAAKQRANVVTVGGDTEMRRHSRRARHHHHRI